MFNIGGAEVLIIALVALVVVGPEQLPSVMRKAGQYASQIRTMSSGLRQEFMAGVEELDPTSSKEPRGTAGNPIVPKGYAERVKAGEAGNPFKAKPVSKEMAAPTPEEAAAEAEAEADRALKRAEAARERAAQLRAEASNRASAAEAQQEGETASRESADADETAPVVKRNAIADANASRALE